MLQDPVIRLPISMHRNWRMRSEYVYMCMRTRGNFQQINGSEIRVATSTMFQYVV